jgi:hypothetical protein
MAKLMQGTRYPGTPCRNPSTAYAHQMPLTYGSHIVPSRTHAHGTQGRAHVCKVCTHDTRCKPQHVMSVAGASGTIAACKAVLLQQCQLHGPPQLCSRRSGPGLVLGTL